MSGTGLTPQQESALAELTWKEELGNIKRSHEEGARAFQRLRYGKWSQWRMDVTTRNFNELAEAADAAMAYALALEDFRQFVKSKL